MQTGLYRVVATVEFPVYDPDMFVTHQVRPPQLAGRTLRRNDHFRVIQSKNRGDGFVRALITMDGGYMVSIKVGELIPRVAFERIEENSLLARR